MVVKFSLMGTLLALGGCLSKAALYDQDGDGSYGEEDCDESDPEVYPGSLAEEERLPNGLDDDCDGRFDEPYDLDEDGVLVEPFEEDCDDTDASVYPGAEDTPGDGVDQDCDGEVWTWETTVSLDELVEAGENASGFALDDGGRLGSSVSLLGDLDGDGLDEVGLGDPLSAEDGGHEHGEICLLRYDEAEPILDCEEWHGSEGEVVGWGVASGDLDADGCVDLAMSQLDPDGDGSDGVVLYFGVGATEGDPCESAGSKMELAATKLGRQGAITLTEDLDGDGGAELVLAPSSPLEEDEDEGRILAWLYGGMSPTDEEDPEPWVLRTAKSSAGTPLVRSAGDVDGDGRGDLLVALSASEEDGRAWLLLGKESLNEVAPAGEPIEDIADVSFSGASGEELGAAVAGGSDLDGDGADDVVLGAPGATNAWGRRVGGAVVFLDLPGDGTLGPDEGALFVGALELGGAGASVALPGDTALDGSADLLVGSDPEEGFDAGAGEGPRAWLALEPGALASPGAVVSLLPSDTIVGFQSAGDQPWAVAAAGDLDLAASEERVSGPEFLLVSPEAHAVVLIWGMGL